MSELKRLLRAIKSGNSFSEDAIVKLFEQSCGENNSLKQQLKAEQDAHKALRERLKEIEWVSDEYCPVCYADQYGDDNHKENCWLAKALEERK